MKFTVWNYQHGNTYIEVQYTYLTLVLVTSLLNIVYIKKVTTTHLIFNLNYLHQMVLLFLHFAMLIKGFSEKY